MFVDRHEITAFDKMSDDEMAAKVAKRLGSTKEVALAMINPDGMFN